jgi:methylated-DNA-[protein]-cysteine S-methyltransferase
VTLEQMLIESRERLAARALDEGLARVAVDVTDSPLGPLWLAIGPNGVLAIHYGATGYDADLRRIVARYGPGVLRAPKRLDRVKRELDEYFAGKRTAFALSVDLSALTPFQRRVLAATKRVRFGRVRSYREIATAAGMPSASRATGNALGANPIPIVVPCHRVLGSDGSLHGYAGGLDRKRWLLRLEGVTA